MVVGLEGIIDCANLTEEIVNDAIGLVQHNDFIFRSDQHKVINFLIELLKLANKNLSDYLSLEPHLSQLITDGFMDLKSHPAMSICKYELFTLFIRLSKNQSISIKKLSQDIKALSDHRKWSRFYLGAQLLTKDLKEILKLMPTDCAFNRLMSIVRQNDHVLHTTVLKNSMIERHFIHLNDQFLKNIMKLASSHDQELVNSIQTLITLKNTRKKYKSHVC